MDLYLRIALFFIIIAIGATIGAMIDKNRRSRVLKGVPEESRIDVLRKYSKYDGEEINNRHSIKMVLNKPVPDILLKYNYPSYCNVKSDNADDIVFAMLDFVCDNFRHDGNTPIRGNGSLVGVIRSYEKMNSKTNCRGLSLILAEALRMNGVKARHVTCKPYEEPFSDCHVVVDCIMPSGARIMLDPTYRLYFTDDNGEYVSIAQLREGIIERKSFHPNVAASYNGGAFSCDDYIEYMTKNVLRFNTNYILNDTDSSMTEIELIPSGYSVDGYRKSVQYTTDPDYFWDIM